MMRSYDTFPVLYFPIVRDVPEPKLRGSSQPADDHLAVS